jgi:hypothetical protein
MTFRDIFGFNRITSFGPLTVSESIEELEQDKEDVIEQEIVKIIDDINADPDNLTQSDKKSIKQRLPLELYGGVTLSNSLLGFSPAALHENCMESKWANGWQKGATRQTVQTTSELEEIVSKASVCASLVESDCNPLYKFNLIFSEDCINCNSDNTSQNVFSKLD